MVPYNFTILLILTNPLEVSIEIVIKSLPLSSATVTQLFEKQPKPIAVEHFILLNVILKQ